MVTFYQMAAAEPTKRWRDNGKDEQSLYAADLLSSLVNQRYLRNEREEGPAAPKAMFSIADLDSEDEAAEESLIRSIVQSRYKNGANAGLSLVASHRESEDGQSRPVSLPAVGLSSATEDFTMQYAAPLSFGSHEPEEFNTSTLQAAQRPMLQNTKSLRDLRERLGSQHLEAEEEEDRRILRLLGE